MSDTRVTVLAGIDRQLRLGTLPPSGRLEHPGPIALPSEAPSRAELVSQFASELESLAGSPVVVPSAAEAVSGVRDVLGTRGVTRVLAWEREWLNCEGLAESLESAGIVLESCQLPSDPEARHARLAALDPVRVGLTGALAGLADTGSLVLVSGPGRGRMASLLPPVHVAVLRAETIYPTYAAFLAAHPSVVEDGSNVVLVTGPSRTADIEMTLTRGVHGPGEVIVFVVIQ